MKRFWLTLAILLVMVDGKVFSSVIAAQDDFQNLILTQNDLTVEIAVPAEWVVNPDTPPNHAEAQSHESAYLGGTDFRAVQVRLDAPSAFVYGDLPAENRMGALMGGLKASLPFTENYDPALMSEVDSFTWDGFSAAVFIAYRPSENNTRYEQWIGLALAEESILLVQFAALLPEGEQPRSTLLEQFAAIRASITVNRDALDPASGEIALSRLVDPNELSGSTVASLKITDGAEVRLAAPETWLRRNMTERAEYPTVFFYEDDWRLLAEGDLLTGALIQVSLIAESRILSQLEVNELPENLLATYSAYWEASSYQEIVRGTWLDFTWGDVPARALGVRYPPEYAAHSGGTIQQIILAELDGGLLLITIFAPATQWDSVKSDWQTALSSAVVDGEILPIDPLLTALESLEMP